MVITYLFRSPGSGHSIEELFDSLQREVTRQLAIQTNRIQLPYVSRGWWSVWKNLRFLRRAKADVFHVTGDVHYAVLALPAARTILTIHDCSTLKKNQNRPLRYLFFWLIWYYLPVRRAGFVTVVSEKTRQELIRYVGQIAQKSVVIANGYNPAFMYRPAEFRKKCPVLLQLGTAPNKNLARLITAIDGIACTLVIVGPLTDDISADLQQRRIDYRNYVNLNRAEILDLYTDCDIVTFVSTYEGFGMPVLEANAVGRVVITSAIAPISQIAHESAHLINPVDIAAIRQGILRLIQDDAYRQTLIEAGGKNALRYSTTLAAAQYAALYQKIALSELSSDVDV